jgi:hypothetical protein
MWTELTEIQCFMLLAEVSRNGALETICPFNAVQRGVVLPRPVLPVLDWIAERLLFRYRLHWLYFEPCLRRLLHLPMSDDWRFLSFACSSFTLFLVRFSLLRWRHCALVFATSVHESTFRSFLVLYVITRVSAFLSASTVLAEVYRATQITVVVGKPFSGSSTFVNLARLRVCRLLSVSWLARFVFWVTALCVTHVFVLTDSLELRSFESDVLFSTSRLRCDLCLCGLPPRLALPTRHDSRLFWLSVVVNAVSVA